jgi:hypothetical protein
MFLRRIRRKHRAAFVIEGQGGSHAQIAKDRAW